MFKSVPTFVLTAVTTAFFSTEPSTAAPIEKAGIRTAEALFVSGSQSRFGTHVRRHPYGYQKRKIRPSHKSKTRADHLRHQRHTPQKSRSLSRFEKALILKKLLK